MFIEKYDYLCSQIGKSPNAVAKELSIASGTVSEWRKGRKPQNSTIKKIAGYFGVPVEYFKEDSSPAVVSSVSGKLIVGNPLTSHEHSVIMAYRAHPEMQLAIDKLLGIDESSNLPVHTAANSDNKVYDEYTNLDNEEFMAMKDEPRREDVT